MKSMVEVGPPRLASAALPEDAATLKKFVNQRFKNVGVGIFGFLLFLGSCPNNRKASQDIKTS